MIIIPGIVIIHKKAYRRDNFSFRTRWIIMNINAIPPMIEIICSLMGIIILFAPLDQGIDGYFGKKVKKTFAGISLEDERLELRRSVL